MKSLLIIFLLGPIILFGSKIPEISPNDVCDILQEIMHSHVSYKKLSRPLVKRALVEYLDEVDPLKAYLLKGEVLPWLEPTEALLDRLILSIENGDFSFFESIHQPMVQAIGRRIRLEEQFVSAPLSRELYQALEGLDWAETEEELKERLGILKSLEIDIAEKIDPQCREKVMQRLAKRRKLKEEGWFQEDSVLRQRSILTHVLKAFSNSFDSHTAYFTPAEAAQFMIQVQQRLFGIGVQLRDDLNGFTVVKIIQGGPASASELKVNDRLIAIEEEPIIGMELADAVELIRGEEGTPVKLTVLRQEFGEEIKKTVVIDRKEVVIQEARFESHMIPFADGVIAHLVLYSFYQDHHHNASADLYEELLNMKAKHKLKGIILDLRQNSGGVLPQAVALAGLFISKGIVVSIKDHAGGIEHIRNIEGKTAFEGPLVVLTSKASASAAEIVAQTLQDYGRAILVGDAHTYGKGTFQSFTLDTSSNGRINPKGEYKVTRGRYYTASGKSPQLVGVVPDLIVPGFYSEIPMGEQHAKFPLENDSIGENFHDDLSDIPILQRDQFSWLYRLNLQPRLKTYIRHLPVLKENSQARLNHDPFFQSFLQFLKMEMNILDMRSVELFKQNDPQLKETVNILKDLILLTN